MTLITDDQVGDDLDFLLRSTGGSIVPFLRHVCEGRSWPFYMKSDEKTGASRWDFICMGDKEVRYLVRVVRNALCLFKICIFCSRLLY